MLLAMKKVHVSPDQPDKQTLPEVTLFCGRREHLLQNAILFKVDWANQCKSKCWHCMFDIGLQQWWAHANMGQYLPTGQVRLPNLEETRSTSIPAMATENPHLSPVVTQCNGKRQQSQSVMGHKPWGTSRIQTKPRMAAAAASLPTASTPKQQPRPAGLRRLTL